MEHKEFKQFVDAIFEAGNTPKSGIQLIPTTKREITKGCLVRFRMGTTY